MSHPIALSASNTNDVRAYPDLADKRVFIAGAPIGAGSRIARAFARHGCRIVLHFDRHREHMFALAERIRGQVRGLRVFHCSLDDEQAVQRLTETADGAFGGLDIVVTMTGQPRTPTSALDADELECLAARSLTAPYWVAKHAARAMQERRISGSIVHVSTLHPGPSPAASAAYGALRAMTRGGLEAMVRDQAQSWAGDGIRVNAIVPEGAQFVRDPVPGPVRQVPALRRHTQADDIASVALFLGSSESAVLNGALLTSQV